MEKKNFKICITAPQKSANSQPKHSFENKLIFYIHFTPATKILFIPFPSLCPGIKKVKIYVQADIDTSSKYYW